MKGLWRSCTEELSFAPLLEDSSAGMYWPSDFWSWSANGRCAEAYLHGLVDTPWMINTAVLEGLDTHQPHRQCHGKCSLWRWSSQGFTDCHNGATKNPLRLKIERPYSPSILVRRETNSTASSSLFAFNFSRFYIFNQFLWFALCFWKDKAYALYQIGQLSSIWWEPRLTKKIIAVPNEISMQSAHILHWAVL